MADAIIVLGRNINSDGTLPPDPISRVNKAVELYKQNKAPIIVMSGGYSYHLKDVPNLLESTAMKQYAISLGVPPKSILEESRSTHTLANAFFTKKFLCEPNGWRSLVIVASDEHMPRVKYVFEKTFGPNFTIEYAESDRVLNDDEYEKELVHEKSSIKLSIKYLDSVKDGDDETIKSHILKINPNDTISSL